jgi:3',5'-cyclic AMP phosphodiesterase CpdA
MKIIHISDLHFGLHKEELIPYFLTDINKIKPEIILISGDMTHRATSSQYKLLQKFINELPGLVLTVPGNHDIPLNNVFERLLYPFKHYKRYISQELMVHAEIGGVKILGVNSVNPFVIKDGKLSSQTLENIKNYFASPFAGVNLLFFHHNFDYVEGLHKPLQNYNQFLNCLKESSIHIVCTGHLHFASVGLIQKNNDQPCLRLHAGSLLCQRNRDGRHSYYSIELHKENCRLDWRVFKDNQFITDHHYEINFSKPFLITAEELKK